MHHWQRVWPKKIAQLIDQQSIQKYKLPAIILMEHAGKAVAKSAQDLALEFVTTSGSAIVVPESTTPSFIIIVGKGNNGGDGLVAARWLRHWGKKVHVFCFFNPSQRSDLSPLTAAHLDTCEGMAIPVEEFSAKKFARVADPGKNDPLVIIDALYGIGFRPPLPSEERASLVLLDAYENKIVLAVDVPSGMQSDAFGQDESIPLPAQRTLSFGAPKPCHITFPNAQYVGNVEVVDIGFVASAVASVVTEQEKSAPEEPQLFIAQNDQLLANNLWHSLKTDAHKFDRGHILVLGGSPGKWGAPVLAAMAALRSGAGWASVSLCHDEHDYFVPPQAPPEITFENFFQKSKLLTQELCTFIQARKVKSLIIGPGMMGSKLSTADFQALADLSNDQGLFIVFDAGVLLHLLDTLTGIRFCPERCVATPHPGEWLKLSQRNPVAAPSCVEEIAALKQRLSSYGITFVYKNAAPMIFDFSSSPPLVKICRGGSNSMAKAGTGDILSGIIASHGAIGYKASDAVARAYALLAQSADKGVALFGQDALLARDLIWGLSDED